MWQSLHVFRLNIVEWHCQSGEPDIKDHYWAPRYFSNLFGKQRANQAFGPIEIVVLGKKVTPYFDRDRRVV
jgi:hypothetical protein